MTRSSSTASPALVLTVLAIACAGWAAVHVVTGFGLQSGDAHDYAQIARRIATGRGFTTGALYPAELAGGVTAEHPSVYRAPLWSVVLAGAFRIGGPEASSVHAAMLLVLLGIVTCGTLLATHLAGRTAGVVAGVAIATSPHLLLVASDGLAEPLVALWAVLAFLLLARQAPPFWIGAVCGLAYLTHYAAAVLLPAALLCRILSAPVKEGRARALAWMALGFVAAASPWWLRNGIVAGNPVYTLSSWVPYLPWEMAGLHRTPLHALDPQGSGLAVDPIEKLRHLLPVMLGRWPLASMNLVACLGVVLGCVRREWLSIGLAGFAGLATLMGSLSLVFGRYLLPVLPLILALGVASWTSHGRRLRIPALALLLLSPLLPAVPPEPQDLALLRAGFWARWEARGDEAPAAPALATCIEPGTIVLAENAPRMAWETDAIAIRLPATKADLWTLVERVPVRFAHVSRFGWVPRAEFVRGFARRPACGPAVYERRASVGEE